jgi:putative glycosyltransferase
MTHTMLSVVTSTYNSANHIVVFHKKLREVLDQIACDSEILMVDDGSIDETVRLCRGVLGIDPSLKIVELSRNFGQDAATVEGLKQAKGNLIFLTDSDLEEPPETLLKMLEAMRNSNPPIDLVYGVQGKRRGTLQHRIGGALFYAAFNLLADVNIPVKVLAVRLMTRRYLDAVLMHRERTLALTGLFALAGFEQQANTIDRRYKGYTSYSLIKRIGLALRYTLIFSTKPALAITGLGFSIATISGLYALFTLIVYSFAEETVPGWTTLVLLIMFLNGLLLISVGVCAAHLGFIFQEVKQRPGVIIKHIYEVDQIEPAPPRIPAVKTFGI